MNAPTIFCNECGAANALQATSCFACNKFLHAPVPPFPAQRQAVPPHAAGAVNKINTPLAPSYLLHSRYSIVCQVGTGGFGAVYQAKDTLFSNRPVAIKEMSQDGLSPQELKDTIPLGSRGYAAPEQYGKAQSTPQTDIYGLGATLHQLLTGDDPSLNMVRFEPVELHNSPISAHLNDLLKQMVEMEMDKRPANMAVVRQQLQQFLARQTARHLSASQQSAQAKVGRRNFLIWFSGTVVTCSSGIAITSYLLARQNAPVSQAKHPLAGNTASLSSTSPVTSLARTRILGVPLYTYLGHSGPVIAVAWSPHADLIASAGTLDDSVQIWNAHTGDLVLVPVLEIDPAGEKAPSLETLVTSRKRRMFSRRTFLVLGGLTGLAGLGVASSWMTGRVSFQLVREFPHPRYSPNMGGTIYMHDEGDETDAVAWSPDGTRLVVGKFHVNQVQSWDANTGQHVVTYSTPGLDGSVFAVIWLPNGETIAAGGDSGVVWVWDAVSADLVTTYAGHKDGVIALANSPDGKYIVSGGFDDTVQIWEVITGRTMVTYRGHHGGIGAVAWSPDGRYIASASFDKTVQVWEAATGHTVFTYRGHSSDVYAVAWSPDGQHIASGGKDKTVQVWPVTLFENDGRPYWLAIITYRGHTASVQTVAWSPDSRTLASAGENVQLWNGLTGRHIFTYTGHDITAVKRVVGLAWSPNGRYIASVGFEMTVQVWNATNQG